MSLLKKTRKSITKTRASLGRLGAHNEKISFSLEVNHVEFPKELIKSQKLNKLFVSFQKHDGDSICNNVDIATSTKKSNKKQRLSVEALDQENKKIFNSKDSRTEEFLINQKQSDDTITNKTCFYHANIDLEVTLYEDKDHSTDISNDIHYQSKFGIIKLMHVGKDQVISCLGEAMIPLHELYMKHLKNKYDKYDQCQVFHANGIETPFTVYYNLYVNNDRSGDPTSQSKNSEINPMQNADADSDSEENKMEMIKNESNIEMSTDIATDKIETPKSNSNTAQKRKRDSLENMMEEVYENPLQQQVNAVDTNTHHIDMVPLTKYNALLNAYKKLENIFEILTTATIINYVHDNRKFKAATILNENVPDPVSKLTLIKAMKSLTQLNIPHSSEENFDEYLEKNADTCNGGDASNRNCHVDANMFEESGILSPAHTPMKKKNHAVKDDSKVENISIPFETRDEIELNTEEAEKEYPLVSAFTSNIITALSAITATKATIGIDVENDIKKIEAEAEENVSKNDDEALTTVQQISQIPIVTANGMETSKLYNDPLNLTRTIKERNEALDYISLASNIITHSAIHRSVMAKTIAGLESEVVDLRSMLNK